MTGTCRWGEFGEGGLLWGECSGRQFEWFEGNPVNELLLKVCMRLPIGFIATQIMSLPFCLLHHFV